ncbi:uncharacterized protein ATC70_002754 [Mucor velutinosus]|uniref:Uncharacterized protein n=1 Tax=Mucor velutinosus TaxID=708070 RepID=A0AAN7DEL8_9FUNG|nr:hypothetical protein ATC70_002754 [Mucor velutinosus]
MQAEKEQAPQEKTSTTNASTSNEEKQALNFKSLHFGWFVGHALVVLSALAFAISNLVFHPLGFFYRLAYLGVIASYGIVLWNSYKPLTNKESYFKLMLLDENFQYLIIAVFFLFSRRVAVTLIPFFIYSVFHVLDFVDADLIPQLAPHQTKIQSHIQNIVSKYYDTAMILVAKIEVCGVMTRLVLGLFVFRSSILSILVYTQFLRMRYYMSEHTREFLTELGTKVDKALTPPTAHPKIPPAVVNAYATAKEKLRVGSTPAPATTAKKQL